MLEERNLDQLSKVINPKNGEKLVFISGNFNCIHPGHHRLLKFASSLGDRLILGINYDTHAGVMFPEKMRLEAVDALGYIDNAFVLKEGDIQKFIELYKPAYIVKGKEYEEVENVEQEYLSQYGGKLVFFKGGINYSSLELLKSEAPEKVKLNLNYQEEFLQRHKITKQQLVQRLKDFSKVKPVCNW